VAFYLGFGGFDNGSSPWGFNSSWASAGGRGGDLNMNMSMNMNSGGFGGLGVG
jgi:hypothetical protein